jgi:hypothetical protein
MRRINRLRYFLAGARRGHRPRCRRSRRRGADGDAAGLYIAYDEGLFAKDGPVMQRIPDAMFEFGLTPGLDRPYDIATLIQSEPGEIR